MTLLSREDILEAAHELYCVSVNSQWDEIGMERPREWAPFIAEVDPLDDSDQLSIMWRIIGRVEQAWGYDVGLVFHHAGITDIARALYYLVMGCLGHGVGLWDDHADELALAESVLLKWAGGSFDPAPILIEDIEWREAAELAYPGDPINAD